MAVAKSLSFGNTEMIQIADAVAREKNLDRDSVLDAMEQAIQTAGRRKYGLEHDIRAEIDRNTGEIQLYRQTHVVEELDEELAPQQMLLVEAKKIDASLEVGSVIKDPLPPIDFGRIAAQTAKQVIVQKVREAERQRQYEEFKDKEGEIVNGTVKRVEYGNVIVDFGRTEAMIRKDEMIPREAFRVGDRIRAYIYKVSEEAHGPQVLLSRTHPDFMRKLFAQEVPEIYDGLVEIVSVARDPGSRAKIAVVSHDPTVNPVLSCVGVRGTRVQAVVTELQGERVDIVEYSEDPATFIVNALSSAEVTKVVLDEDNNRVEVVVPDDQLSLAIGRRGQNVRLASQLIGWNIDILTEDAESERRSEEFNRLSSMFVDALNVEEVIAHLLVTEGFTTIDEVAYVPVEDLSSIEGFDEDVASELRQRARDYLEAQLEDTQKKLTEMGVSDDLLQFELLPLDILKKLPLKGVKSLDDLADLSAQEFMDLFPEIEMDEDQVNELIMAARAHWFDEDGNAAAE
jgi:N utilization substance protein A